MLPHILYGEPSCRWQMILPPQVTRKSMNEREHDEQGK